MQINRTGRGFEVATFIDRNGFLCSIQKSSLATEDCIWLGTDKLEVSIGMPWTKLSEEDLKLKFHSEQLVSNNRMHLNRDQVAELLPILQKFVETGDLS